MLSFEELEWANLGFNFFPLIFKLQSVCTQACPMMFGGGTQVGGVGSLLPQYGS